MKIADIVRLSHLMAILTLSFSTCHAAENNGLFLLGKYGSSVGFQNCTGNCNTDLNGTVGIGVTLKPSSFPYSTLGQDRDSWVFEYSRYQLAINGNVLNVRKPSINWYGELDFGKDSRFSAAFGLGAGWQTTDGTNSSSRATLTPEVKVNLLYELNPALRLSLGFNRDFIYSGAYRDIIYDAVELGFRWYL